MVSVEKPESWALSSASRGEDIVAVGRKFGTGKIEDGSQRESGLY